MTRHIKLLSLLALVSICLSPSVHAAGTRSENACEPQEGVSMGIELHGWALSHRGADGATPSYKAGSPISIKMTVRNRGTSPRTILLQDHDEHLGTLSFPNGTRARVTDARGAVLTNNDVEKGGWWSSGYLSSSITFGDGMMPGDVVRLLPGEEVVRIIPLDAVLAGCKGLREGLEPGDYRVQLSLCGIVSEPLEIRVR